MPKRVRRVVVEDEGTIEMLWQCTSCTYVNKGRHVVCQECKNPKDGSERYFSPGEDAPVVTDPKLLKLAANPENWKCPYCNSHQRDESGLNICKECKAAQGGEKKIAEKVESEEARAVKKAEQKEAATATSPPEPLPPPPIPPEILFTQPRTTHIRHRQATLETPAAPDSSAHLSIRHLLLGGIGLVFLVLGVWWLVGMLRPYESTATVTSLHWKRSISIETRSLLHVKGWGHAPGNAFNIQSATLQKGTKQCNPYTCGQHDETYPCKKKEQESYTCTELTNCRTEITPVRGGNGNGFGRKQKVCDEISKRCTRTVEKDSTCTKKVDTICYKQCPVYDTWSEYDIYRWQHLTTPTTQGRDNNPYWPARGAQGKDERESNRSENYTVTLTWKNNSATNEPHSESDFRRFELGSHWRVKVNRFGSLLAILRRE